MLTRNPRITAAGLALFTNQLPGFSVSITHVALGNSVYDPTGSEVSLRSEFARFPVQSGAIISPSQIQIGVLVKDADPQGRSPNNKYVGEIGFYVGTTLFAVLSQAGGAMFYKSPQLDVPISYVLNFSTLPPGSLTVGSQGLSESLMLAAHTAQAEAAAAREAAGESRAIKAAIDAGMAGYVFPETSFVPVLSSDGVPPTYRNDDPPEGTMTRVGGLAFCRVKMRVSITNAGSGTPRVTGFPFESKGLEPAVVGLAQVFNNVAGPNYMVSGPAVIFNGSAYQVGEFSYLVFTITFQVRQPV